MNAKQTNKLASYTAIEAALKALPEIATVPGLPARLAALSARTGEINSLATTQTQPMQLTTLERDMLFDNMTDVTLEVAGYVRTVAREQKLPLLGQSVQLGRGEFRRVRRAHRVWFAQRVLEAAQTVRIPLEALGVTADTLAALQAVIEAARDGANLPRHTVAAKKAATEQLAALFTEVDALIEDEIDPLVFPLRKTNPGFYSAYRTSRAIVDRPGNARVKTPEVVTPMAVAPTTVTALKATSEKAAA